MGAWHLGRVDDMAKVLGKRVELAEVEAAISAIEGVGQAAVGPYVGNQESTRLRAVAVPPTGAGAILDGRVLRAILARQLPVAMIPDSIHVAPAISMLAAGKVDREGVAEMVAEMVAEAQRYRPVSTERGAAACGHLVPRPRRRPTGRRRRLLRPRG
jgi:acyl-coenzyme A synthetase/AMP-(fatty) acid ligase